MHVHLKFHNQKNPKTKKKEKRKKIKNQKQKQEFFPPKKMKRCQLSVMYFTSFTSFYL